MCGDNKLCIYEFFTSFSKILVPSWTKMYIWTLSLVITTLLLKRYTKVHFEQCMFLEKALNQIFTLHMKRSSNKQKLWKKNFINVHRLVCINSQTDSHRASIRSLPFHGYKSDDNQKVSVSKIAQNKIQNFDLSYRINFAWPILLS